MHNLNQYMTKSKEDLQGKSKRHNISKHFRIFQKGDLTFFNQVCQLEHQLFDHFFPSTSEDITSLNPLVDPLCTFLYDTLRPKLIHETNLDVLCELVDILKIEVVDINERLTFRARTHIRDEIANYPLLDEDLDDHGKLEQSPDIKSDPTSIELSSNVVKTWYPPLEKTVSYLSKLYNCLEQAVFIGLAQEAVEVCSISIQVNFFGKETVDSSFGKSNYHKEGRENGNVTENKSNPNWTDLQAQNSSSDLSDLKSRKYNSIPFAGPNGVGLNITLSMDCNQNKSDTGEHNASEPNARINQAPNPIKHIPEFEVLEEHLQQQFSSFISESEDDHLSFEEEDVDFNEESGFYSETNMVWNRKDKRSNKKRKQHKMKSLVPPCDCRTKKNGTCFRHDHLSGDPNKIWILCGDFNEVRSKEERKGSMFSVNCAHAFNSFIANCGPVDLHLGGRKYTWMNTEGSKFSKMDRFLVSNMFLQFWTNSNTLALPRLYPDHCPIMLNTNSLDFGPLPF
ncbi:unnamed protein product [Lactuca saligna]|uniref:Conserved oligomeric Golgi complex subunit 3 C-terminal domain-containing protein n=1 Tax=Lactuca saligna TaxID=75948 RepID=A0AA35Y674_LACSI|nr:unnamed protein product [Lactuca saligna]